MPKMKKITILIFITAVNLAFNMLSCAQNKSSRFKEIIFADYRTNDSAKKLNVIMTNYIKITSDGQCRDMSNEFNGINFSGYRKDTTFKISDSLMVVLNNFFAGDKKLSSYTKAYNIPDGANYQAPYQYIYYRTNNNKTDSLINIIPDNDNELAAIYNAIWHLPFPKTTYTGKIYHDKILENKIATYHKKVKNLPTVAPPPSVQKLLR
jgi:hypothetical protein